MKPKTEQAHKLIELANHINATLTEELLQDTYGVNSNMRFHLDDKTFVEVATLSKVPVESSYTDAACHCVVKMGVVEFHVCHNFL